MIGNEALRMCASHSPALRGIDKFWMAVCFFLVAAFPQWATAQRLDGTLRVEVTDATGQSAAREIAIASLQVAAHIGRDQDRQREAVVRAEPLVERHRLRRLPLAERDGQQHHAHYKCEK